MTSSAIAPRLQANQNRSIERLAPAIASQTTGKALVARQIDLHESDAPDARERAAGRCLGVDSLRAGLHGLPIGSQDCDGFLTGRGNPVAARRLG